MGVVKRRTSPSPTPPTSNPRSQRASKASAPSTSSAWRPPWLAWLVEPRSSQPRRPTQRPPRWLYAGRCTPPAPHWARAVAPAQRAQCLSDLTVALRSPSATANMSLTIPARFGLEPQRHLCAWAVSHPPLHQGDAMGLAIYKMVDSRRVRDGRHHLFPRVNNTTYISCLI